MSTCPSIRSRSCHVPVRPAARAGGALGRRRPGRSLGAAGLRPRTEPPAHRRMEGRRSPAGFDRLGGSTNATASPSCGWPRSARPPSASCPRSSLHSTDTCCRAPHLTSRPGTDRRSEAQRQTAPRTTGRTRLDTVPEAGPAPRLREPHRPRRCPARRRAAAEEGARALAAPSLDPAADSTRPTSAAEGERSDAEYREAERHHRSA